MLAEAVANKGMMDDKIQNELNIRKTVEMTEK